MIDFKANLYYSLFNEFGSQDGGSPHRPRCSLKDLKQNWSDWNVSLASNYDELSKMNALDALRSAFSPKETDVGIYLELDSSIREKIKNEQLQQQLDSISRQGFKPVTEPITKAIKSPA
ncbi:MAG: hypothetical protein HQ491_09345, partial [Bacteroidetes bacterium]|nr:hypothetical protein [Bacteroidota bacterium]